jgi:hypothetical protein
VVAHGAEIPATGASGEHRKEGEEGKNGGMGGADVEPSGGPDLGTAAIQRDEEEGAEGEKFPSDEEMEAIGDQEDRVETKKQNAPPESPCGGRSGVVFIGPIFLSVDSASSADDAEEGEEESANGVQTEMKRFAAEREMTSPFPAAVIGEQDPDSGGEG